MDKTIIRIEVDADTAKAYRSASAMERKKLQLLMRLWMQDLAKTPDLALNDLMDQMSEKAEARGLTPEILDTILNDA